MFIKISIDIYSMAMKKLMLAVPEEMFKVLEKERKERLLESVPETVRMIISEYFRSKMTNR